MPDLVPIACLHVEDDSLDMVLARAGVSRKLQSDPYEAQPTLVAWSHLASFLESPDYAWLSQPEACFVQLPASLDHLVRVTATPRPPVDRKSQIGRLLMPLGQWRWAVGRLREAVSAEAWGEAAVRLGGLRRFASRNWPGAYDEILLSIHNGLDRKDTRVPLIGLSQYAEEVAAIQACRAGLLWSGGYAANGRITRLRDVLCYACQGLVAPDAAHETAMSDPWWRELAEEMLIATESLHSLEHDSGEFSRLLYDSCEAASQHLRAIEAAASDVTAFANDRVKDLSKAVDCLASALDRIAEASESVRLAMAESMDRITRGDEADA